MKKKKSGIPEKKSWLYFFIGAVIGLIIAILLMEKSYCLNTYQPGTAIIFPGLAFVGILLTAFSTLSKGKEIDSIKFFERNRNIFLPIGGLFIVGALAAWIFPLFYQFDKNYCAPDFDKLVALVDQEGSAVINEDMAVIRNIYTPDAIVTQADTHESWAAYTYYSIKFATQVHCTNNHGDYDVIRYTSTEVIMTSSSRGTWGLKGQGCIEVYPSRAGSDRWTFDKIGGEWKIVNFEFNLLSPASTP